MLTHFGYDNNEYGTVVYMFYDDGTEESIVLDACAEGFLRQDERDIAAYALDDEQWYTHMQRALSSAAFRMGVEV
jgi:hypothetical protein